MLRYIAQSCQNRETFFVLFRQNKLLEIYLLTSCEDQVPQCPGCVYDSDLVKRNATKGLHFELQTNFHHYLLRLSLIHI